MLLRLLFKPKEKLFVLLILLMLVVSLIYYCLSYLQENYKTSQWSGDRCMSELTSVKYQLDVVTEYKNRIDKLLTEAKKSHESEKERFKDVMESCVAMRQQSAICQSQFEDLQSECRKVKEDYDKIKDIQKLKTN